MAKYRTIDVRLWTDRKFGLLSDHGKLLWLYLLTSPFMLPIPGVIVAGEMAIAEQLGWNTEGVLDGFRELFAKGLRVRRHGRLTWLHRALAYQPIQGPNHIAAIGKSWDDVPECDLKLQIWQALKIACKSWGVLFAKGIPEPVSEGIANPFRTVSGSGSGSESVTRESGAFAPGLTLEAEPSTSAKPSKRKHPIQLPGDWKPSESTATRAAELEASGRGVSLEFELAKMRDWATAKGEACKDWDARWRNWLRSARPLHGSSSSSGARSQHVGRIEPRKPEDYGPTGDVDI